MQETSQVTIHRQFTKDILGNTPPYMLDTPVYVQCSACGEVFIREYANATSPHRCLQIPQYADHHRFRAEYRIISPNGKQPTKSRATDVGYDLYSAEDVVIPGSVAIFGLGIVRTGIELSVPRGYYYTIEARSGLSTTMDIVPVRNIIDAAYTGEICVKLLNYRPSSFHVKIGHRIAQIVYHRAVDADHTLVDEFSPSYSIRGAAGFGSSGV